MNAEFNWWLLIVGLVVGAGLVWLVIADWSRREEDVAEDERSAEAAWISDLLADRGDNVPPETADEILAMHRDYLRQIGALDDLEPEPVDQDWTANDLTWLPGSATDEAGADATESDRLAADATGPDRLAADATGPDTADDGTAGADATESDGADGHPAMPDGVEPGPGEGAAGGAGEGEGGADDVAATRVAAASVPAPGVPATGVQAEPRESVRSPRMAPRARPPASLDPEPPSS
jgi:hypothetical protein